MHGSDSDSSCTYPVWPLPAVQRQGAGRLASPFVFSATPSLLENIPEQLVVNIVVELNLARLHDGSQQTWATIGRGLLQVGIPGFHILAQDLRRPRGVTEVL